MARDFRFKIIVADNQENDVATINTDEPATSLTALHAIYPGYRFHIYMNGTDYVTGRLTPDGIEGIGEEVIVVAAAKSIFKSISEKVPRKEAVIEIKVGGETKYGPVAYGSAGKLVAEYQFAGPYGKVYGIFHVYSNGQLVLDVQSKNGTLMDDPSNHVLSMHSVETFCAVIEEIDAKLASVGN